MKRFLTLYLLTFVVFLTGVSNIANAANDPVAMLTALSDKMIENLKAKQASLKTDPSVVYSIAYKVIVPHADIAFMSKKVLPPQTWNNASAGQRSKFESAFTRLLVRTYASALSDYTNQTVEFRPVRGGFQGKTNVAVSSQIVRSDGPPVAVLYSLVLQGSQWKLYDLNVEGISLLESFRSQFSDKLSQGNIDSLIADLEKHSSR